MWKITLLLLITMAKMLFQHVFATPITAPIATKKFQINYLNELSATADATAQKYLNELLLELQAHNKYNSTFAKTFQDAQGTAQLERKILFIKQLFDVEQPENNNLENFYILRNVNFLEKLVQRLEDIQAEKLQEMQQMRMFHLCKQFREQGVRTRATTEARTFKPPYSRETKLMPMEEHAGDGSTTAADEAQKVQLQSINITEFGQRLYENVKTSGAEIIDEYLSAIRKLLHDVSEEKPEEMQHAHQLDAVLNEIDNILKISDFYEKRQRLYTYLQGNLAADYEKFRVSESAQEVVAELFIKLKSKGMDLFVAFLFSNFEFLERLHEEWSKALPKLKDGETKAHFDDTSKLLYSIPECYAEFKLDSDDSDEGEKYERYLLQIKTLYEKVSTMPLAKDVHIFEMLYNSSMNLGRVTLNMIRAKCDDL